VTCCRYSVSGSGCPTAGSLTPEEAPKEQCGVDRTADGCIQGGHKEGVNVQVDLNVKYLNTCSVLLIQANREKSLTLKKSCSSAGIASKISSQRTVILTMLSFWKRGVELVIGKRPANVITHHILYLGSNKRLYEANTDADVGSGSGKGIRFPVAMHLVWDSVQGYIFGACN